MNILVLCTGNSARSILLESILNTEGKDRVQAYSAGSQPAGRVHPHSLILLDSMGHDISSASSQSWDAYASDDAPIMDVVITVCASAAGETCPLWPTKEGQAPITIHWGVDDPAKAEEPEWEAAFQTAYARLHKRATAFLAEPFEDMDRDALKALLTRVGSL
ncbi:MAG: arsenate reductase ArsC [Marinovum sp.]|nr:arsenate reductase ArsC [Marinovum sp.]